MRFILFPPNVSELRVCFTQPLFHCQEGDCCLSVCASGLRVTKTDWAQLLAGRPSPVFTAWQHPHTSACPRRVRTPSSSSPHHHHHFSSLPTLPPHPSCLLLRMNNAGGLLNRRYQHATACFIHAKVRQISPRPGRRPPSSPWPARPCGGQRPCFPSSLMDAPGRR